MSTLEEIKKRKLQQYMEAQQAAQQQAMYEMHEQSKQIEQIKEQLKVAMSQIMSKEAMQRLSTLRATRPEFALQAELFLLELYKHGKLKPLVSDQQLKEILLQITENKKETKIRRK